MHVRQQSGNVLSYVAVIVKNTCNSHFNYLTECIIRVLIQVFLCCLMVKSYCALL